MYSMHIFVNDCIITMEYERKCKKRNRDGRCCLFLLPSIHWYIWWCHCLAAARYSTLHTYIECLHRHSMPVDGEQIRVKRKKEQKKVALNKNHMAEIRLLTPGHTEMSSSRL